jgi:hypothetical protein
VHGLHGQLELLGDEVRLEVLVVAQHTITSRYFSGSAMTAPLTARCRAISSTRSSVERCEDLDGDLAMQLVIARGLALGVVRLQDRSAKHAEDPALLSQSGAAVDRSTCSHVDCATSSDSSR